MTQWVLFKRYDEKGGNRRVLVNLDRVESVYEPDNLPCLRIITADGRGINIDYPAEDMLLLVNACNVAQ